MRGREVGGRCEAGPEMDIDITGTLLFDRDRVSHDTPQGAGSIDAPQLDIPRLDTPHRRLGLLGPDASRKITKKQQMAVQSVSGHLEMRPHLARAQLDGHLGPPVRVPLEPARPSNARMF
jgi:hypothetical protein